MIHLSLTPRKFWLSLIVVLCLLSAAGVFSGVAVAAPACAQAYEVAKREMNKLSLDVQRGESRAAWEKLAQTFLMLYEKNPRWLNRPAALLRSGEAYSELGSRSLLKRDNREALARFQRLARECPESQLADDALLRAARLQGDWLGDSEGALKTIELLLSRYPSGDMAASAQAYIRELKDISRQSGSAVLLGATWKDENGFTKITLDFDRVPGWKMLSYPGDTTRKVPPRLIVELRHTIPVQTIRPVVKSSGSQLRRMRVDLSRPGVTRLLFDFKEMKRFIVTPQANPLRLVITASPSDKGLSGGMAVGGTLQSRQPSYGGLTVILDPGHGGKDEGLVQNGLRERDIVLTLSQLIRIRLQERGIQVVPTRSDNTWVSLETRARIANKVDADLLLSLHVRSDADPLRRGMSAAIWGKAQGQDALAFVQKENGVEPLHGANDGPIDEERQQCSLQAATFLQTALADVVSEPSGKTVQICEADFTLLAETSMPGVMLNLGFLSNTEEAALLASQTYLEQLAQAIVVGILKYDELLKTQKK